uniref:Synaptopodin n=1 Tax=Neogobius melanostomus TaxID=47308 RepID=A0A8C6WNL7_9GOBI
MAATPEQGQRASLRPRASRSSIELPGRFSRPQRCGLRRQLAPSWISRPRRPTLPLHCLLTLAPSPPSARSVLPNTAFAGVYESTSAYVLLEPTADVSHVTSATFSTIHSLASLRAPNCTKTVNFCPSVNVRDETPIQIKSGILEEGAARRANRKAMFTFKEKPTVAPNPDLLSMVKGVDAKKKQSQSVPEPTVEEELMALGAEASNFLAKEVLKAEEAKAPEWASSLKTSRARPRAEHRPEHTLTNVSGKGAELFAKRQSRMEKYVVEEQKPGLRRSPSPTMSLPPSWVYPSNMPGRVKAIAKNSDMSAQLSQNLIAQQAAKQKPKPKVPIPQQAPPPAPAENGCSKIEMDLSRHRPYQLDSSLFILKPVHPDPLSTLPRGAPQTKNITRSQSLPRQTTLANNPLSQYRSQCMSPPLAMSPTVGCPAVQHRITSPAFSPERVASPRSGVQAPRPTFSAKKAGLEGQKPKESSLSGTHQETGTPSLMRRFSSPAEPSSITWSPARPPVISPGSTPKGSRCQSPLSTSGVQHRPVQTPSGPSPWGSRCQSPSLPNTQGPSNFRPAQTPTSPISPPWGSRCQSPMTGQNIQSTSSAFTSRPSQTSIATSSLSPPWATRCKSPLGGQNTPTALSVSKPAQTSPVSPVWGSRSQSPLVNHTPSTSRPSNTAAASPVSPWGSRCQSPALSQTSLSFSRPLYRSAASSPVPKDNRCMSPSVTNMDLKANHRLLAKNIINAAKRKNSVSPGALSGHNLPISPMENSHHGFDSHKPPISPFNSRSLGAQSPTFTSPPLTPTVCSPVRLYNTRSLTDSDASVESEDSGLRSPGLHYNTLPRGWGGSLRVKRTTVSTDL